MADWSASQYLKFEQERTQPSRDLANRITLHVRGKIMDLGCGPGNSTRVLAERFPDSEILGVDNSADMIAKARTNCPECEFQLLPVSPDTSLSGRYDLIFSNACIQWIPDHKKLIPNLFSALSEDGVLAVQVPETRNMPMYKILSALSKHPKWAQKIAGIREFYTLELEEYYELLGRLSPAFSIWETNYIHITTQEVYTTQRRAIHLKPTQFHVYANRRIFGVTGGVFRRFGGVSSCAHTHGRAQ